MSRPRRDLTVRVVSLGSREADEATVEGTAAERLALVTRLSETSWRLTGRPWPAYSRATMPVVVTTLRADVERG